MVDPQQGEPISGRPQVEETLNEGVPTVKGDRISSKEDPVVNVTWFGAKGDGSTDDRKAIQDAINHAESISPAVVFFPQGRYYLGPHEGHLLHIQSSDILLKGEGKFASILESHDDTGGGDYTVFFEGSDTEKVQNVGMMSMGYENHKGWDPGGLVMKYVDNGFLESVYATNEFVKNDAPGLPIWMGRDEGEIINSKLAVRECYVVNSGAKNNKTIEMAGTDGGIVSNNLVELRNDAETGIGLNSVKDAVVTGNSIRTTNSSTSKHIGVLGCENVSVIGNLSDGAGNHGISLGSARAFENSEIIVVGNVIRNCGGHGINGGPPTAHCSIVGNHISNTEGDGINVSTGRAIISGNSIWNTGGNGVVTRPELQCRGVVIASNRIMDTTGPSVVLHSPQVQGALVSGNLLGETNSWNTDRIRVVPNNNGDIPQNFAIVGNIGTQAGDGIHIDASATEFLVSNNKMNGSISYAGIETDTEVFTGNSPRYYTLDEVSKFPSGGTRTFTIGNIPPGTNLEVNVQPDTHSDNDLGFRVDSIYYDASSDQMKVRVSETEDEGGGDARITVSVAE